MTIADNRILATTVAVSAKSSCRLIQCGSYSEVVCVTNEVVAKKTTRVASPRSARKLTAIAQAR